MSSPEDIPRPQNGDSTPSQPPPLPSDVQPPPLPKGVGLPPSSNRNTRGVGTRANSKAMMFLVALSVALAGYVSCLIASHIHWSYRWIAAPAILPGLSFGLVLAGWLLNRGRISRRKAIGLVVGSTVAYLRLTGAHSIPLSCAVTE